MRSDREHPALQPRQKLPDLWISREVDAYRQGVDEESDQVLDLQLGAVRVHRADHEVVLLGVAVQQERKRRQQRDE